MENTDNFALEAAKSADPYIEEKFEQVDPNAVEKQLLDQFKEMQDNMPPEDVAAHFFQIYYPGYVSLLGTLSNKDARRVAQHVVQWPLEDQYPDFHSNEAKQAFQLGIRLLDCKMIMKGVVEMERVKEAQIMKQKNEQEAKEKASQTQDTVVVSEQVVESDTKQGDQVNG